MPRGVYSHAEQQIPHINGEKRCSACEQYKPLTTFHNDKQRWDGKFPRCYECEAGRRRTDAYLANRKRYKSKPATREKERIAARARTANRKRRVIDHYGGKCACCGERSIEFLSLDHIDGGGSKHRKTLGAKFGSSMYVWAEQQGYPIMFRVLCMNCNWARGQYGYCPHEAMGGYLASVK